MNRSDDQIMGMILENGVGFFFTARVVYDFTQSHDDREFGNQKIVNSPFRSDWGGEYLQVNFRDMRGFVRTGPTSARFELNGSLERRCIEIRNVHPHLLSAFEQVLKSEEFAEQTAS